MIMKSIYNIRKFFSDFLMKEKVKYTILVKKSMLTI